jgi:uncharacterized lipoprotein YmbA
MFVFEKGRSLPWANQKTFIFLAFALAGCSSPDPTYFTLQPTTGPIQPGPAATIEVRRPGLAGYLDRNNIVLKSTDYKLALNTQKQWAEPLGDMIGRVLTQDLSQRLPGRTVFGESGAITANADLRVEVDIENFDADGAGDVILNAQFAVEQGATHRPLASHHVSLHAAPASPDATALAATMSTLLGQLADQISASIAGKNVLF